MPFVIGENIGPYRLVEQLGQGGVAAVFKVYHPALDRYVAIKALHPALTGEPKSPEWVRWVAEYLLNKAKN
jgi:serine/threonine protein kinase